MSMFADTSPTDTIIGSVVVITATTVLRRAKEKTKAGTTFEPIVFGFLLTIMLLIFAIFAPGFAKGLALLGLVGAFAVNGPSLFSSLSGLGK